MAALYRARRYVTLRVLLLLEAEARNMARESETSRSQRAALWELARACRACQQFVKS